MFVFICKISSTFVPWILFWGRVDWNVKKQVSRTWSNFFNTLVLNTSCFDPQNSSISMSLWIHKKHPLTHRRIDFKATRNTPRSRNIDLWECLTRNELENPYLGRNVANVGKELEKPCLGRNVAAVRMELEKPYLGRMNIMEL